LTFGARAAQAPTFENVITRTEPRTDAGDVRYLAEKKRFHKTPVQYYDRFYLRHENDYEHGWWISKFKEDAVPLAVFSVFDGQDPALTEYFPTISDQVDQRTQFYFVLDDDRTVSSPYGRTVPAQVKRVPRNSGANQRVKLVAVDHGLGSYNVLGAWADSPLVDVVMGGYCYYSNDYIEGDNDRKERWILAKPDDQPASDDILKYGDWITLENEYFSGRFLNEYQKKWLGYWSYPAKWRVMPY
jgi:hypothetical protein